MPIGAILQMGAIGAQDKYLTGNPQITYFKFVYKQYSLFAIEEYEQYFHGAADFGKKVFCKFDRIGDLISNINLYIHLPSLYESVEEEEDELLQRSWINSIGHVIIKEVNIEIGGHIIDTQYGLWMEIWSELTINKNKQDGYNNMIGKHENFNASIQSGPLKLTVPLQFWFNKHSGLALPIIALQNVDIRLNLTFRQLDELWISNYANDELENPLSIIESHLNVTYIFLDDSERKLFAQNEHEILIEQLQIHHEKLNVKNEINKIKLDFNHPCKELIWVVQNESVLIRTSNGGNEWFNFSDRQYNSSSGPGGGSYSQDNLKTAVLKINGEDRFKIKNALYFRRTQPYLYHTNVPNNYIYCYSFALHPEDPKPSGTCNFSRVDNLNLNIEILPNLTNPMIIIFTKNYNILQIANGNAGVLYSN